MKTKTALDQSVKPYFDEQPHDWAQLAEILIEAIPIDRKRTWSGKVMAYLASQSALSLNQGSVTTRVTTKAIHADLKGNPNQEPSQWLSPIWKQIEQRYYPEIEPRLIDLCRQAGLASYPFLEKDNGKPAFYYLSVKPLPALDNVEFREDDEQSSHSIRYAPDLSLRLSLLGKLFFNQGLKWTPFRRFSYLSWQLFFLIAVAAFEVLLWLILWHSREPLTGQDLVVTTLAISLPLAAYWHLRDIFRLFDDRIMIAPEWALAWKEFGATIEINRTKNPDEASTIRVQRYSTKCPICGWMVKLDRGEPDFPRRIVGRCEENPREHVFSFDRSSKFGVLLQSGVSLQKKSLAQNPSGEVP